MEYHIRCFVPQLARLELHDQNRGASTFNTLMNPCRSGYPRLDAPPERDFDIHVLTSTHGDQSHKS